MAIQTPSPASVYSHRPSMPIIWHHHTEITRESGTSGSSRRKFEQKSDSAKSNSKSSNNSSQSKQKNTNSSSNPDLVSKLGKDGKLTPQEHQCCLDNKLCLFGRNSGHIAKNFLKTTSASSKA